MSDTTALVSLVIKVALWSAAGWATISCLFRGWSSRRLAARSRSMLITGAVDAVIALALVRALAPPPGFASWLWVLACGAVGIGFAGAVRRWRTVPAFKPSKDGSVGRHRRLRALATSGYVVVGLGLVAVLA